MLFLTFLSIAGIIAGLLLLRRVPTMPTRRFSLSQPTVSVIIPARDEETNLPPLLESLRNASRPPLQILVVDDGSTDRTATVAAQCGATVIPGAALPAGWTGKTWACHQGMLVATGDTLFFLDADTCFINDGYTRAVEYFATLPQNSALSLLPFHRTQCWYEELSLFFNIVMAMGAGGFGKLDPPHLFGQSLLIEREIYAVAGGHESVKREILENLHFAPNLRARGGKVFALGGRGVLEMRMFPHGLTQLKESWQKAFAAGARTAAPLVLGLSICWLTAAMLSAFILFALYSSLWPAAAVFYSLYVIQIAWYGRQLGTFRWPTAVLFPIPLVFYFAIFGRSAWHRGRGVSPIWRGRRQ